LEERAKAGQPIDQIASVASVFVSRIDTAIDKLLGARTEPGAAALMGKAGIANLKMTYKKFEELFHSDRFAALKAKGAKVQRPLWASTSTKNPAYADLMYVTTVVGADTVNTMPPNTLEALLDHGTVNADTVHDDLAGAQASLDALATYGVDLHAVTDQLVVEGVKSFAASFDEMLATIAGKQEKLAQHAAAAP
jgi:transaldolase